jgi:hypothetical protein
MKSILAFFIIFFSSGSFADLLFIQNQLPDAVTLVATFNNRDRANSPMTTNFFLIAPSNKLESHSLNDRQRELGFIDYQKIQITDDTEKEICSKNLSNVSPNTELKISVIISKKGCQFDVQECKNCFQSF